MTNIYTSENIYIYGADVVEWYRVLDLRLSDWNPRHFGTDLDISVLDISVLTWTYRYSTVRDLDETLFGTDHNCLVLINCQYFCTSSSLIYDSKVDRYVFLIIPV